MDRMARNLHVRVINGLPGFTVVYEGGKEEHFCFSSLDQAKEFHATFGAVIREVTYSTSTHPGEALSVSDTAQLCIQPPKED